MMNYLLVQLVVLHVAFAWGSEPRHGFGGGGEFEGGLGGVGGLPADLFPSCANSCFQMVHTSNKAGGVCDIKDTKCICNDQQVQSGTACCISNTCNSDDQAKAQKFIQGQCSPLGVTGAGFCQAKAVAPLTPAQATVPELAQDPVTVPMAVPVTVPETLTSVLLTTSVLTSQSLVVITSIQTKSDASGTAATSKFLSSATSFELVTTVLSSTNIAETDTPSTSFSNSISTRTGSISTLNSILSSSNLTQNPKPGISSGAKAGIAISVLLGLSFLAVIPFWLWRRKRQQTLDREFQELKEAHESDLARPTNRVVPPYPSAVVPGTGYRDVFDPPGET